MDRVVKIERVIDRCGTSCRYFKKFITEDDNHTTAYICAIKEMVICIGCNRHYSGGYDFPQFCGLENYTGDKTDVYND